MNWLMNQVDGKTYIGRQMGDLMDGCMNGWMTGWVDGGIDRWVSGYSVSSPPLWTSFLLGLFLFSCPYNPAPVGWSWRPPGTPLCSLLRKGPSLCLSEADMCFQPRTPPCLSPGLDPKPLSGLWLQAGPEFPDTVAAGS